MRNVDAVVKHQYAERIANPDGTFFKINLYRGYEVEAVAKALSDNPMLARSCRVESMMVADSYLMTHLGRKSTSLESEAEQAWFLEVMLGLVGEVRAAIDASFPNAAQPLLMGDMPDGTTATPQTAVRVAAEFERRGADIIKVEIPTDETLAAMEAMAREGYPVVAHLGYAPQAGVNRRYGESLTDALWLFERARRARDAGASAFVLERVDETVNQALCQNHRKGRLVYGIFSGRAPHGGQSLNVFDSVFMPPFKAQHFPPTALYTVERYPRTYSTEVIAGCMALLMRLTVQGIYPKSPPSKLTEEEIATLRAIDPWAEAAPMPVAQRAAR